MAINMPDLSFVASPIIGGFSGVLVAISGHATIGLFLAMVLFGTIGGMFGCWCLGYGLPKILMIAGGFQREKKSVLWVWQNLVAGLIFLCWGASYLASGIGGTLASLWLLRTFSNAR